MPRTPRSKPPPRETPAPPTPQPSASISPPTASSCSAPLSLPDWIRQAGPAELADLQTLIDQSAPPSSPTIVRTLAQVADWFSLELQTVKQWRSSGCPGIEGAYDVREIARWRMGKMRPDTKADPTEKNKLELEQLDLANSRLRIKLRKEAGELVSRQAAKSAIRQMFAKLKSQLEPLAELLAPLLPNELRADFRRDCGERVRILLQQIANFRFERDVTGAETPEEEPDE
jgi:hypothetical protein